MHALLVTDYCNRGPLNFIACTECLSGGGGIMYDNINDPGGPLVQGF